MQSPLLAGEDADVTPSLSAGPPEAEDSEFSRLIAQRSPLDILSERFDDEDQYDRCLPSNYALLHLEPNNSLAYGPYSKKVWVIPPRRPFTTAVAGTLSFLHLLFVWAAYTADVWAESRVRISVLWQEKYLPLLNDAQENTIRSTNLMSLLQDLNASRNYLLMILLWSVSLILPCAFMIMSPTFVLGDSMHPILYSNRTRCWNGRGTLETLMRWAFLTFYVVILLGLATSFIELQWTDTSIQVGARACGSLAAYFVGIACAVGLAVVLRWPPTTGKWKSLESAMHTSQETIIRIPPPQAFQHPWSPANQEDVPSMTVLEETSPRRARIQELVPTRSGSSTPELVPENDGNVQEVRGLAFWKKFIVFQLGLLSVILWIPSFYLPFLRLSYGGLATNFLTEPVLSLYVWDISFSLWNQGIEFGTPVWIILAAIAVLLLTTVVLPLLASCLGTLAWVGDENFATKCYSWLFAIHPALGSLIFATALLALTHALTPFSSSLLDQETSGVCQKFNDVTGETCLDVKAKVLPGFWFYLAESIVLELFVVATLKWC
ncbi:hypothetical protein ACA910_002826 [Epithemia clementina (nom. ined.)]